MHKSDNIEFHNQHQLKVKTWYCVQAAQEQTNVQKSISFETIFGYS